MPPSIAVLLLSLSYAVATPQRDRDGAPPSHPTCAASGTPHDNRFQAAGPDLRGAGSLGSGLDPIRGIAVSKEMVVVGRDRSGLVQGLNRLTLAERWRWQAPNWIHNDPVVAGDMVVVTFGDNFLLSPAGDPNITWTVGRGPGGVAVLRLESGVPVWSVRTQGAVMTSAVVRGDTVVVATGGREVIAYRLFDGAVIARRSIPGINSMANPIRLPEGLLIATAFRSGLSMLTPALDSVLWRRDLSIPQGVGDVTPAVDDSTVYTTGTELIAGRKFLSAEVLPFVADKVRMRLGLLTWRPLSRQWVVALSRCTGEVRWQRSLGVGYHVDYNRSGTPVLDGDGITILSPVLREVIAMGAAGSIRWRVRLKATTKGRVFLVRGGVLVPDVDRMRLLASDTGMERASWPLEGRVTFFTPIGVGRTIIFPLEDGRLGRIALGPTEVNPVTR